MTPADENNPTDSADMKEFKANFAHPTDSADMKEFKANFAQLCRSTVFRNRTKSFIDRYQRHFGTQIEVDDVLAEVFIRALRAVESGQTIQNLSAWARTASLNVVRELYRATERKQKLEKKVEQEFSSEAFDFSESDEAFTGENSIVEKLWARLKTLSLTEQKILLWEAEGKPYRTISELLIQKGLETKSLSENAIARQIRHARTKLRGRQ
jgi:RNA polymerase sigma factor (sigma-70 family)